MIYEGKGPPKYTKYDPSPKIMIASLKFSEAYILKIHSQSAEEWFCS